MEVSSVGFGSAEGPQAEKVESPQDEFLRLLVAQLEQQDPLAPQDSAQFVAQLAQFTQVEQTAETNVRLQALEAAESAGLRSSFANIVGRDVTARSNKIVVADGQIGDATHKIRLDGAAAQVEIIVRNDAGDEVARFEKSSLLAGDTPLEWDGKNKDGSSVSDGTYTFEVTAQDADGKGVEAHVRISGRATAIDFEGGNMVFKIGSADITPAEILSIAE